MTKRLLKRYFSRSTFYHIGESVDNPDSRITEDVKSFVSRSVSFGLLILSKILNLFAFSSVLWSISPTLVLVLAAYSIIGTFATVKLFGDRLKTLAFASLKVEANLRFCLVRIREHAESIAFFRGGPAEEAVALKRLAELLAVARDQIVAERSLATFQNLFEFITYVVPGVVIAPRFFRGEVEFGVIAQATTAFGVARYSISFIITHYGLLSEFGAVCQRLCTVLDAMDQARVHTSDNSNATTSATTSLSTVAAASIHPAYDYVGGGTVRSNAGSTVIGGFPAVASSSRSADSDDGGVIVSCSVSGGGAIAESEADASALPTMSRAASATRSTGASLKDLKTAVGLASSPPPTDRSTSTSKSSTTSSEATTLPSSPSAPLLEMRECDIRTPNTTSTLLLSRLSLTLRRGEKLLIIGPSGSGKSSVLRTMAKLWRPRANVPATTALGGGVLGDDSAGHGTVCVSPDAFFLPQKPYMKLGTLREQLEYPSYQAGALTTSAAVEALTRVGLLRLSHRLGAGEDGDQAHEWSSALSTGEQQRLSFARLWLHAPPIALLDEATSALDAENEVRMYDLLAETCSCYVSVGHRMSLLGYHTHVLKLGDDGSYKLCTAEAFKKEAELSA